MSPRPRFRPNLVALESRIVPAWWAVSEPDSAAGTPGDTAAIESGQLSLAPALNPIGGQVTVEADTPEAAVGLALAGGATVTFDNQTMSYTFSSSEVGSPSDRKPFAVTVAGGVAAVALEDLAGRPGADYDYNDHSWAVNVAPASGPRGGAGFASASSAPSSGGSSSGVIYSGVFPLTSPDGNLSVALTVTADEPGHLGEWKWDYVVTNIDYGPQDPTDYGADTWTHFTVGDPLDPGLPLSAFSWSYGDTLLYGESREVSGYTPPQLIVDAPARYEEVAWYNPVPATGTVKAPGVPSSVGDRVWDDLNGNGVQDGGEPGHDGVTVRLLGGGGVLATTTTSGGGLYTFGGLAAGSYQVQVVNPDPTNLTFSRPDRGYSDALDSDTYADQAESLTETTLPFTLAAGENNTTIDAALRLRPSVFVYMPNTTLMVNANNDNWNPQGSELTSTDYPVNSLGQPEWASLKQKYIPRLRDFDTSNFWQDDPQLQPVTVTVRGGQAGTLKMLQGLNAVGKVDVWLDKRKSQHFEPVEIPAGVDPFEVTLYVEGTHESAPGKRDDVNFGARFYPSENPDAFIDDVKKLTIAPVVDSVRIDMGKATQEWLNNTRNGLKGVQSLDNTAPAGKQFAFNIESVVLNSTASTGGTVSVKYLQNLNNLQNGYADRVVGRIDQAPSGTFYLDQLPDPGTAFPYIDTTSADIPNDPTYPTFITQVNARTVNASAVDAPGRFMTDYPSTTNIDFQDTFRMHLTVQYPDKSIYSLGYVDWSVAIVAGGWVEGVGMTQVDPRSGTDSKGFVYANTNPAVTIAPNSTAALHYQIIN